MNALMLLVAVFLLSSSLLSSVSAKEEIKDRQKGAPSNIQYDRQHGSQPANSNIYGGSNSINPYGGLPNNYGGFLGGREILRNRFPSSDDNSKDESAGEDDKTDQGTDGSNYPYPGTGGSSYPYPGIAGPDEIANGVFSNPFLGTRRRTSSTTPDSGISENGNDSDSDVPYIGGTYFPSYGSQPGIYNSSPGIYNSSPGIYNSSPGSYAPQPGIYSSSPGSYSPQPGISYSSPGSYVPQPGIYSSSPGRYGPQPGIYSSSPGSYGQQPGIYSSSPGLRPAVDQGYVYPVRGINGNRIGLRQPDGAYGLGNGNGYGVYPGTMRNVPSSNSVPSGGGNNVYNGSPGGYGPALFGYGQYPQLQYPGLGLEYGSLRDRNTHGVKGDETVNQKGEKHPYSQSTTSTHSSKEEETEGKTKKPLRKEDP